MLFLGIIEKRISVLHYEMHGILETSEKFNTKTMTPGDRSYRRTEGFGSDTTQSLHSMDRHQSRGGLLRICSVLTSYPVEQNSNKQCIMFFRGGNSIMNGRLNLPAHTMISLIVLVKEGIKSKSLCRSE